MNTSSVLPVPYSYSYAFQKGGIYDPTAANFPLCKHFWSCPQSDIGKVFANASTGGLTDLMGRCNLLKATNVALAAPASPDGFSVFPNQAGTANVQGSLVYTAGKFPLLIAVGTWGATTGPLLGDSANGAGISLAKTNVLTDNAANTTSGTAFSLASQTTGRALLVRTWNDAVVSNTTGLQTFEATATTTVTALGNASTNTILEFTGWGPATKWSCVSTNLALHGMAYFEFTTLPTDAFVKSLLSWLTYHWSHGNKWLPPQLKGMV